MRNAIEGNPLKCRDLPDRNLWRSLKAFWISAPYLLTKKEDRLPGPLPSIHHKSKRMLDISWTFASEPGLKTSVSQPDLVNASFSSKFVIGLVL